MTRTKRVGVIVTISLAVVVLFVASQILWLLFAGKPVPPPDIPHGALSFGSGSPLTFAVLGDSTSVGQGGDYAKSIAMTLANKLAETHQVQFINAGVSGARAADVAGTQLQQVVDLKPDIVLIAVGANDVTHTTDIQTVRAYVEHTVLSLVTANCNVKIILTGSPAMGTPPRIPQPLRYLAGKRTDTINQMFTDLTSQYQLTFAPIAAETGPVFVRDHSLFAADKFHPNTKGYDLWNAVLRNALDEALGQQPSHCK